MTRNKANVKRIECKFDKSKECIRSELFDKWNDDKKETAFLTLGICPQCPIYKGG